MIYVLSHSFGPFWFADPTLFINSASHSKSIAGLTAEYTRSDEQFIKAFQQKYSDLLPPSWMLLEIASFSSLSMLYKNLSPGQAKRQIANLFGLDDKTFTSWLHSIVYLRNVCAHHSRLWNRVMSIQPRILRNPQKMWLQSQTVTNDRTYFALSMILFLLQTVNSNHRFLEKLELLFSRYPEIDKNAMGFEATWQSEPLWQQTHLICGVYFVSHSSFLKIRPAQLGRFSCHMQPALLFKAWPAGRLPCRTNAAPQT